MSLATFSFPSGHTSGATVFYGVLAACLVCREPALAARALIVAGGRDHGRRWWRLAALYLGAHYLSDVLAGMAVGGAWLAVCITAVSTLRRRHASAQDLI